MVQPTYTKVLAEPQHRKATKIFLQHLSEASRLEGWRETETFNNWLKAASCALAGVAYRAAGAVRHWEANEDEYMSVVRACSKPDKTMSLFAKMLSTTTVALKNHDQDFLGPIFMEISANAHVGQFFTPVAVSKLIASITFDNIDAKFDEAWADGRGYITVHEPTCGVGAMVLAANAVIKEHGHDVARNVHWTCVDVDLRCVRASYIQLSLTGASAYVVHGNTLKLEEYSSLPTIASIEYPKLIHRRKPENRSIEGKVEEIESAHCE